MVQGARWKSPPARFASVQDPRRQVRRHRFESHHQRGKISSSPNSRARASAPENLDHHRTGDLDSVSSTRFPAVMMLLATTADLYSAQAVLIVGSRPIRSNIRSSRSRPRANFRHHAAHLYAVEARPRS